LKNLVTLNTTYQLETIEQLLDLAKLPKLRYAFLIMPSIDLVTDILSILEQFLKLAYNKYRRFQALAITFPVSYDPSNHIRFLIIEGLPVITTHGLDYILSDDDIIKILRLFYQLYPYNIFDLRNLNYVCTSFDALVEFIMNSQELNTLKINKNLDSIQILFINRLISKINFICSNTVNPIDLNLLNSSNSLQTLQLPIYIEDLNDLLTKYPHIKNIIIINQPLTPDDLNSLLNHNTLHIQILHDAKLINVNTLLSCS